jgi:agmatinase
MTDPDRPLVLSRRLVRTRGEGAACHVLLGSRVEITERGWDFLESFRKPASPEEVLTRLGVDGQARVEYEREIARFVVAGVLVPPDEEEYLYRHGQTLAEPYRPTIYRSDAPFLGSERTDGPADFRVVGVPLGQASGSPGAARGARAIREASAALPAHHDPRTGAFLGLFDHAAGRLLLEGARIADQGDIYLERWGAPSESYRSIHDAATEVLATGTGLPVFLGGDHSITEPLVRAVAARKGLLHVVHVDAHTDMSAARDGVPHHHGNVMEVVRHLPSVTGILQIGVRDLGPPWWRAPKNTVTLSTEEARRMPAAEIVRLVPPEAACYVTIDIDVLDPGEAPGTLVPVPGGLRLVELVPILTALGRAREIAAVDLAEVAPDLDRSNLTAKCAVRLLLALMDAVHRRQGDREPAGAPEGPPPGR